MHPISLTGSERSGKQSSLVSPLASGSAADRSSAGDAPIMANGLRPPPLSIPGKPAPHTPPHSARGYYENNHQLYQRQAQQPSSGGRGNFDHARPDASSYIGTRFGQSTSGLFPFATQSADLDFSVGPGLASTRMLQSRNGNRLSGTMNGVGASALLRSVLRNENIENDFYWLQQLQRDRKKDCAQLERSLQLQQNAITNSLFGGMNLHGQYSASQSLLTSPGVTLYNSQAPTHTHTHGHQSYGNTRSHVHSGSNHLGGQPQPPRPFSLMRNTSLPDIDTDSSTGSLPAVPASPTSAERLSSNSDSNLMHDGGGPCMLEEDSPPARGNQYKIADSDRV
jgi:hypothetical protein